MTKFLPLSLALALAGTASVAAAQTPPPPPPPEAKSQAGPYVMAAGMSDLYEINSSQVALQKTQNPAIRRYADMLIKHHQKTTAATVKAAQKAGMTPPPPMLDAGATASINELQAASGADFDRLYLGQQVPAHQAALKASARKAVPIVKQHLAAAEKMMNGGTHAGDHKM